MSTSFKASFCAICLMLLDSSKDSLTYYEGRSGSDYMFLSKYNCRKQNKNWL